MKLYVTLLLAISSLALSGCATLLGELGRGDLHTSPPSAQERADEESKDEDGLERPQPKPKPPPQPRPVPTAAQQAVLGNLSTALATASRASGGFQRAPAETLSYPEILDPDRTIPGSLSMGTVRIGRLQNAAILPETGPHHSIIERHRVRRTNFGTRELVQSLQDAAAEVYLFHGGAPLRVGNLGYARGGRIPWSASHEAGRDADLAFYVLDLSGESVASPDLLTFDDQGIARGEPFTFDVARNWALTRALLLNPEINVQWLFISEGLKRLLLEYAAEIGEPQFLLQRASRVLHQPTDALPHDDHLHLRVGCSQRDRLEGCLDWGPRWDWYDWHEAALFARSQEIQRALQSERHVIRLNGVIFLRRIRSPFAPELILRHVVDDPHPSVREEAFDLLEDLPLHNLSALRALAEVIERGPREDNEERILYRAMRLFDHPAVIDIAIARYQNQELTDRERGRALRALDHHMAAELIPFYIEALPEEPSPRLRAHLARQLHRISARSDGLEWDTALSSEHHAALDAWRAWWAQAPSSRDELLRTFLAELGVPDTEDLRHVDELIPLLRADEEHLRYNVNLILIDWTGRWAPRDWGTDQAAFQFWSRWWSRNRDRMIQERPQAWQ